MAGAKRGLLRYGCFSLCDHAVLPLVPRDAMDNLKRLIAEGAYGHYGMYEAIDYTPERIPLGEKKGIVKSYMAHHQGMSILALNTILTTI